ncbi:MAG: hypothetical protein U0822_27340, partial [Anaerolineae bacterium]
MTAFLAYVYNEMEGDTNFQWKRAGPSERRHIQFTSTDYALLKHYFEQMEKGIDYSVWRWIRINKEVDLPTLFHNYLYYDAIAEIWPIVFFDDRIPKALHRSIYHLFYESELYIKTWGGDFDFDKEWDQVMRMNIPEYKDTFAVCTSVAWRVRELIRRAMYFADEVDKHPIYLPDPTAQVERPRTYADVIAERANELATLQNYIARVRYVDGAQLKDELITTRRFEAEESAQGRALIVSRVKDFTTDRYLVEQGITQRLKRPVSGTMKKYVPLRNQRDEEAPHLFEDDDEPGFEER